MVDRGTSSPFLVEPLIGRRPRSFVNIVRNSQLVSPERLSICRLEQPSGDLLDLEIVERKGLGHPDTICDEIAERLSVALSRIYLSEWGEVLHHNVDKALLVGGGSSPSFGGGAISRPLDLFLAGRATQSFQGKRAPIGELAHQVAIEWFSTHLPTIDARHYVNVHNLVRPGSVDLNDLFARRSGQARLSNDTSCGVGYAPLSRLETIVYAVEKALGVAAQGRHPEIGRDVKVMGIRRGDHVHLTIACALVDRFIFNLADYLDSKSKIAAVARQTAKEHGAAKVTIKVNAADDPTVASIYLTVTGTSAEAGDDGEAGRGNRVNGLIAPFRPMTMESVAGKNPVTHVGKLYNIAASLIAQRLVDDVPGVAEAQCFIVSQIGGPLDQPQAIQVFVRCPSRPIEPKSEIAAIIADELARLGSIAEELTNGTLAVGRWPLRQIGSLGKP
jgi:S-adenosylmethionine synthetase